MSQRFGVFEPRGSLVVELYSTVPSSARFSSLPNIFKYTDCGNCPTPARKCQNTRPTHGHIKYLQ